MPAFGKASRERLATCHIDLQKIFNRVIRFFDCVIIEGHRAKELQNLYYEQKKSKLKWPQGKHNSIPSKAVDAMPYPIDWKDSMRMAYFAGFVMATAREMRDRGEISHGLRWGHDWDGDTDLRNQAFTDGPHYELIE